MSSRMINFMLDDERYARLRQCARSNGTTMSSMFRNLLDQNLDKLDHEALIRRLSELPVEERQEVLQRFTEK